MLAQMDQQNFAQIATLFTTVAILVAGLAVVLAINNASRKLQRRLNGTDEKLDKIAELLRSMLVKRLDR